MALQRKNIILIIISFLISTTTLFSSNSCLCKPDTLQPPPYTPDTLSGPNEVCQGDTALYSGDFYIGCSNIWYIDDSFQMQDGDTLLVIWTDSGSHVVKAFCNDTNTLVGMIAVTVNPLPHVFLGNDTTLSEGETLLLDAGNPGAKYLWSTGDTTQTLLVTQTGLYEVVVTNDCGEDSDDIFIDILTNVNNLNQQNTKVFALNNQLVFTNYQGDEILTVYALSGKAIYNGIIKDNIKLKNQQLVIVSIVSNNNPIRYKILIP